jgi:hypothetical protein
VVDTRKRTINVLNVIHMEADGVAYPNLFYPRNDVFQMDSKTEPLYVAVNAITAMIERSLAEIPTRYR